MLPRAVLIHRKYLEMYSQIDHAIINYVDEQEAHCDDIVMNMVVARHSSKPPLRVLLPSDTIIDYYNACYVTDRKGTGGLALQQDRTILRNECLQWITEKYPNKTLILTNRVGTCGLRGIQTGMKNGTVSYGRMIKHTGCYH